MIDFLPDSFTRVTQTTIVVPVSDVPDLFDVSTGRVLSPRQVSIELRVDEGTPRGTRTRAYVGVTGPRRLMSGAEGRPISSYGWEARRLDGRHDAIDRPGWLTALLAEHLPPGWDRELLGLSVETGGAR